MKRSVLKKKSVKNNYPSATLLLDVAIKEYDLDENRKTSIESRAGIFLAFVGSLMVLILSVLDKPEMLSSKDIGYESAIKLINLMFYFAIVMSLLITVYYLIKSLSTRDYKTMDYSSFSRENAVYELDDVAQALMLGYQEALIHNKDQNDSKVKLFGKGIRYFAISLILIVIYYSINLF